MAMRNMKRGVPNLFKAGTRHHSGIEAAVLKNLEACKALMELTKTSFGPNGMNKLIINHLEKVFVTNDCATILHEMEVAHPAAKMIVLAADMQEHEIGDGSNFVICLAGALLGHAADLVNMGLHPSEIIDGYVKAGRKALEIMATLVVSNVQKDKLKDHKTISAALKSVVSSKQYGQENLLCPLIAEACMAVVPDNPFNFNVDNVRVVKILGGSVSQSEVIRGMVIARNTEGLVKKLENANVGVYTCSIAAADTETKGTILINTAQELKDFNDSEEKEISGIIKSIKACGVNCIVTGSTVDEVAQHFIEREGMMIIKITSKFELRRLCRAIGAVPQVNLGPIGKDQQGFVSSVHVREIGLKKVTVFAQEKSNAISVATVLLRASTNNVLNDLEKAVDDGVNTYKAMGKSMPAGFVAGGGACEIEIASQLAKIGASTSGLGQYAMKKYAEALEVVPRALAANAGQNAMDAVAALYKAHEAGDAGMGVDIVNGGVCDMVEAGVLDLLTAKAQAMLLATDAAVTVLRVDQIIVAKQAGGPKVPQNQGGWDND